jgi:DNA-binding transcriptional ArsR family regulator
MIRFRFPSRRPAECVTFEYSPLLECVMSLHVLVGPRKHAFRHGWVRQMRSLDRRLRRRIDAFSFVYRRQMPDLFLPYPGEDAKTLGAQFDRIDRLPPRAIQEGFGVSLSGPDRVTREQVIAAADEPLSAKTAALLVDDPREFARQFTQLVEAYWRAAFSAEWQRVEPLLHDSVAEDKRLLARAGIWPLLARLPDGCRIAPGEDELHVECSVDYAPELKPDTALVLTPSTFIWPHVSINSDPRWPNWIAYPASSAVREAVPALPPSELVDVLRALGDETRLRVLKAIAVSPRTTQELAPLVGMSMAGLSKSLIRLADAGLVAGRREGRYVVYSLSRDRIAAASSAVDRFLHADASRPEIGPSSSRNAA